MTQNTDQVRTEFEEWMVETGPRLNTTDRKPDGRYWSSHTQLMWDAWQAARRAQVVKGNHVTFQAQGGEAAPVQMPEPFTTLVRKKSWSTNCYEAAPLDNHRDYGRRWADERVEVYTEHQVRQLLAAQAKEKT